MSSEKLESVYSILSKVLNLKFHQQFKDSGVEFHRLYKVKNLVTKKENYLLHVNEIELRFVTTRDFIFHFSQFLISNINTLTKRYNELIKQSINEFTDEIGLEYAYKQIDYYIYKQKELLKKLKEFDPE